MCSDRACSFESFQQNFSDGKSQLVWRWITADLETPVSAYLKLSGRDQYSFLFESVEGGAVLGRYSIIGYAPDFLWRCNGSEADIRDSFGRWERVNDDALASLRQAISDSHIDAHDPDLPPMAVSGLFGYMGYDMVRLAEDIPDNNPSGIDLPDAIFMRPTVLAIFDNIKNMICLVTPVYESGDRGKAGKVYNRAVEKLQEAEEKLGKPIEKDCLFSETSLSLPLEVQSNMEKEAYKDIVRKTVDYIHQGEIFQAVLSQRFNMDFDLPSFELYRALRRLNPSPFLFYVKMDDFSLVGSSPEILVRVRDDTITIRPIAGTRKRGKTPAQDRALAEDLLADPKECAEHLMLLDLGRNDVGRVSEFGSVNVTDKFMIEYYSHVMHIVSNVEGKLKSGLDIVDALFSGFPAGTVSGAPKVRAMEIIEELETLRRGYYGGGIGYLSGNGTLDTCIALRTALIKNGKVYVQAGAGIVADSDPDSEYQECVNKAGAIVQAAEMAIEQARSAQSSARKRAS